LTRNDTDIADGRRITAWHRVLVVDDETTSAAPGLQPSQAGFTVAVAATAADGLLRPPASRP
jgi:hypothetical protein